MYSLYLSSESFLPLNLMHSFSLLLHTSILDFAQNSISWLNVFKFLNFDGILYYVVLEFLFIGPKDVFHLDGFQIDAHVSP